MANMIDLLWNYKRITNKNPNMSHLYIFYLTILFFSSILGPSTVLLALESAITSVFEISHWLAHLVTYGPTVLFIIICLKASPNTQLNFAMVLSATYALLMMTVFVGTLVSIASEGWYTPSGIFFYILVGTYFIAGLLHPYGLGDLVLGVIYFICIPAGYLLLIIYALCNLGNISWGTRENKTADLENAENRKEGNEKDTGNELVLVTNQVITDTIKHVRTYNERSKSCWWAFCCVFRLINTMIIQKNLHSAQSLLKNSNDRGEKFTAQTNPGKETDLQSNDDTKTECKNTEERQLDSSEKEVWDHIISDYLTPRQSNKEYLNNSFKQIMTDLRNKVAFGFLFLNALWLTIMTAMNEAKYTINIKLPTTTPIIIEPLGFVFLLVFSLILVLQFIGMLMHRYETMLHILSITSWDSNSQSTTESTSNPRSTTESTSNTQSRALVVTIIRMVRHMITKFISMVRHMPTNSDSNLQSTIELDLNTRRTEEYDGSFFPYYAANEEEDLLLNGI